MSNYFFNWLQLDFLLWTPNYVQLHAFICTYAFNLYSVIIYVSYYILLRAVIAQSV
jgi:hypothetical protein